MATEQEVGRVGDAEQALVNEARAGLHPSGFDPSRLDWRLILDVFRAGIQRGTEEATAFEWGRIPSGKWEDELVEVIHNRANEGRDWKAGDMVMWDDIERTVQAAIAIEARRAATLGAVHESAGPQDIAQPKSGPSHD